MGEEYASRLQAGAAEEIRLDADVCLMGEKTGCLLQ